MPEIENLDHLREFVSRVNAVLKSSNGGSFFPKTSFTVEVDRLAYSEPIIRIYYFTNPSGAYAEGYFNTLLGSLPFMRDLVASSARNARERIQFLSILDAPFDTY